MNFGQETCGSSSVEHNALFKEFEITRWTPLNQTVFPTWRGCYSRDVTDAKNRLIRTNAYNGQPA